MNLYELVNPSDVVTFYATDDKTAFSCVLLLSNGSYGCVREDGTRLPTLLLLKENPKQTILDFMEEDPQKWVDQHEKEIGECFSTFQYVSLEGRKDYDEKINALFTEEDKVLFKNKWEDDHRSSMTKIVLGAWTNSSIFLTPKKEG